MMNGVQVSAYIEALPSSNDGTDSNFYPIVGRDTTIGYESIYYLTQEQYDDAVIGGSKDKFKRQIMKNSNCVQVR